MAYVQRVRRPIWSRNRDEVVEDRPVRRAGGDVAAAGNYGLLFVTRIIWLVASIIMLLLAFRFVLSLLGANPSNAFAQFIYNTSHPLVSPFFGLFHYNNIQYGVSRVEVYTLVAILVYGAIAWLLSSIINLGRRYY